MTPDTVDMGEHHQTAHRAVHRLAVLTAFVGIADFIFGAVYVNVLLSAGASPTLIGIGFFCAFAVSTIVEIPSGDMGDRWGQRRVAVSGLTLWGVALIAFGIAHNAPVALLATLAVWSVGQALFSGAPLSLTINVISPSATDLRARAVRWANIAKWGGSATGGIAVFVGALVIETHILISISGAILVFLALWVRFGWPESERFEPGEAEGQLWQRLRAGWKPTLWPVLLMTMVSSALLSVILFTWQPLTAQTTGLPVTANGAVLFVLTAMAALGAWLTRFRDVFRAPGWDIRIALTIVTVGMLLAGTMPGAVTTVLALTTAELLTSYCLTALAMDAHLVFADRYRNLLWSVFSAAIGVSMAATDLVFGLLWDAVGLSSSLAWAGIVGLGVVVVIVIAHRVLYHARKES